MIKNVIIILFKMSYTICMKNEVANPESDYYNNSYSYKPAITLATFEVSDEMIKDRNYREFWGRKLTKTHPDGWTITAEVHCDYFSWVNEFEAIHPRYGFVRGDFENIVEASSKEAFDHFYENHKPEFWDYYDI